MMEENNEIFRYVLSFEKTVELNKKLGVTPENSLFYWVRFEGQKEYVLKNASDLYIIGISFEYIPAFTLQDILDELPEEIIFRGDRCWLCIDMEEQFVFYYSEYGRTPRPEKIFDFRDGLNLIDAAANALIWIAKNGYYEKGQHNDNLGDKK